MIDSTTKNEVYSMLSYVNQGNNSWRNRSNMQRCEETLGVKA